MEALAFDLDNGNVGLRVRADDFGVKLLLVVGQHDFDFVRAVHDVIVGENVAVFADDDARAEGLLAPLARNIFVAGRTEELAEERVVKERGHARVFPHGFGGVNVHHAR